MAKISSLLRILFKKKNKQTIISISANVFEVYNPNKNCFEYAKFEHVMLRTLTFYVRCIFSETVVLMINYKKQKKVSSQQKN